ncbi:MAG: hypothetical protein AAF805_06975, partial [Planctomycetota bacterium]
RDGRNDDLYVALFNLSDEPGWVSFTLEHDGVRGRHDALDLWSGQPAGEVAKELGVKLAPHDAALFRLRPIGQAVSLPGTASAGPGRAPGK